MIPAEFAARAVSDVFKASLACVRETIHLIWLIRVRAAVCRRAVARGHGVHRRRRGKGRAGAPVLTAHEDASAAEGFQIMFAADCSSIALVDASGAITGTLSASGVCSAAAAPAGTLSASGVRVTHRRFRSSGADVPRRGPRAPERARQGLRGRRAPARHRDWYVPQRCRALRAAQDVRAQALTRWGMCWRWCTRLICTACTLWTRTRARQWAWSRSRTSSRRLCRSRGEGALTETFWQGHTAFARGMNALSVNVVHASNRWFRHNVCHGSRWSAAVPPLPAASPACFGLKERGLFGTAGTSSASSTSAATCTMVPAASCWRSLRRATARTRDRDWGVL